MPSFFEHILDSRWAYHFRPTWVATTIAAAILMAWQNPASTLRRREARGSLGNPVAAWRAFGTTKAFAYLIFFALFLALYMVTILAYEDFDFYDNDKFTLYTLVGKDIGISIWPFNGRFFPFAWQEFNIVRHFTNTPTGYQVLPIAQLLIFTCVLLVIDDQLQFKARAAIAILALLTPSILVSFISLIVPERNVLFFLAFLLLSVKRFEQTESKAWAVAAVIFSQFMIFYKETAFLFLLGFAAGRLALRCRIEGSEAWDFSQLRNRKSRLDLCLAFLASLFVLQYYAAMSGSVGEKLNYAAEHRRALTEVVLLYLRVDLIAWLFLAVAMARGYLILRHKTAPSLLWDGLAIGGVACFFGYLALRMFSYYYLASVDLIAILYLGRLTALSWERMRPWSRSAAVLLAAAVFLQGLSASAFLVIERKNVIRAKAEIASVVKEGYLNGAVRRLFFPFASPYVMEQFSAYLHYRGVPVKGAPYQSAGQNGILLTTKAPPGKGELFCPWCRPASVPAPGDLVIVLPDDMASQAEASAYGEGGTVLLSYVLRPHIPYALYSLFVDLDGRKLPDRWMEGSVTEWK